MSARTTSNSSSGESAGKLTRQVVNKAEDLLGEVLDKQELDSIVGEVVQDTDQLVDTERRQLKEISHLLERTQGQADPDSGLTCAGSFELTPDEERMVLTLTVQPPVAGGAAVTVDNVLGWLKEQQITKGVDLHEIKRCVKAAAEGEAFADVAVVRGQPAGEGRDARLELFARRTSEAALEPIGQRLAERTANAVLCRAGDTVMVYHPPEPGPPGHNALGEPIEPLPPQDLEPEAGKNITREGHEFRAEITGVVLFEQSRVEARKAMVIQHDLTRKSEPIDFDGELNIRAAVRAGARVRATGNVTVEGPVEAAEIESAEGDVTLRSGVAGQGAAAIQAGRDVHARFAESAGILARRDIVLQVGSLHSRLIAHHQIKAEQGKGHLVGGVLIAGEGIRVKHLGAKGGVRTDVTVGLSGQTLQTLSQIDQLLARTGQRRATCTDLTEQLERAVGDPAKLQGKDLEMYTKLRQVQLVCDVQTRRLNQRRRDVLAEAEHEHNGRVQVLLSILSNIQVTIGGGSSEIEGRSGPCTIGWNESSRQLTVRAGV